MREGGKGVVGLGGTAPPWHTLLSPAPCRLPPVACHCPCTLLPWPALHSLLLLLFAHHCSTLCAPPQA